MSDLQTWSEFGGASTWSDLQVLLPIVNTGATINNVASTISVQGGVYYFDDVPSEVQRRARRGLKRSN